MATVDKDFRVKNGLVVEGTTATVNGEDVITTGSTTDDLDQGSTNLYFADELAVDAVATAISNGTHTNISITYDDEANSISFSGSSPISTTDDLTEGSTNLYFTNQRALDATASAYDPAGSASTAETNANGYTDTAIGALDTDDIEEGSINLYFTNQRALDATSSAYDPSGSASTAESNANSYTDGLIGDVTVDGTAGNTVTDRIATAVSDLVDGAPELLDTLNELAAAIGDDENFASTITTSIGEKVAKSGDTMTGALTLSGDPTENLHAATKQYVDSEVPDTTDDLTEGSENLYFTNARARDAVDGTDRAFTSVEVNSVALQVAATATLGGTSATTVYSFDASVYRSAKFLVKAAYGAHTEVSEVLLTLDSSDNIAITEYAVVSTNGSLIDITAAPAGIGDNMDLIVTAGTANTTVKVFGTLIA